MGDLHFSQGDGEITFCGAIEMGGFIDLHVDLIKGGMETYGVSENAIFMPGNVDPQYSEWLAFSGHVGDARRRAALPGLAPVLPAGLPARDRLPDEVRLQPRAGVHDPRAPRRSRAGSPAWWTSPTPAPRSTSRPRSSTSTSGPARPARPACPRAPAPRTPASAEPLTGFRLEATGGRRQPPLAADRRVFSWSNPTATRMSTPMAIWR